MTSVGNRVTHPSKEVERSGCCQILAEQKIRNRQNKKKSSDRAIHSYYIDDLREVARAFNRFGENCLPFPPLDPSKNRKSGSDTLNFSAF